MKQVHYYGKYVAKYESVCFRLPICSFTQECFRLSVKEIRYWETLINANFTFLTHSCRQAQ